LVGPFRGAGIALALSLASVVNTVFLLIFLGRNPNITIGSALGSALLYVLKLSVLSGLAIIPIRFISPILLDFFAGRERIISYGLPLVINSAVYFFLGFLMLIIVRDQNLLAIIKILRKKRENA